MRHTNQPGASGRSMFLRYLLNNPDLKNKPPNITCKCEGLCCIVCSGYAKHTARIMNIDAPQYSKHTLSWWCCLMLHIRRKAFARIGTHNQVTREDTWIDYFYQEDTSPWLSYTSHLVTSFFKLSHQRSVKCHTVHVKACEWKFLTISNNLFNSKPDIVMHDSLWEIWED